MWWRVLGVAVVLLALGVAGGYAVGSRTASEPIEAGVPDPVPAVSPAVPTPPQISVSPDPTSPALEPGIALVSQDLRVRPRGAGLQVSRPAGWNVNRQPSSDRWTMALPDAPLHTYNLRIDVLAGGTTSVAAARLGRIAALQTAVAEGNLKDLQVTDTPDGFEATYVDSNDYLQYTTEKWIAFEGETAYAALAVTGRSVDLEGMRDLLDRVSTSATPLDPLPKEDEES